MSMSFVNGRIFSVEGTTPGPASGITYTIKENRDGGGVFTHAGQVPVMRLWPDEVKTDGARLLGKPVVGIRIDNVTLWIFPEPPLTGPCGGPPPSSPPPPDIPGGLLNPNTPPPTQGSGSNQTGGSPTAPDGGGGVK